MDVWQLEPSEMNLYEALAWKAEAVKKLQAVDTQLGARAFETQTPEWKKWRSSAVHAKGFAVAEVRRAKAMCKELQRAADIAQAEVDPEDAGSVVEGLFHLVLRVVKLCPPGTLTDADRALISIAREYTEVEMDTCDVEGAK